MADLDALREALAAALDALDAVPETVPENESAEERRRRLARDRQRRKRDASVTRERDASVTKSVTKRDISRATSRPTSREDGTCGPGEERDSVTRDSVTRHAKSVTKRDDDDEVPRARDLIANLFGGTPAERPVKRCPICDFPLADIKGEIVCLECEERENWTPPSTPEVAAHWHERLAETVHDAHPMNNQADLEARNKRLGLT